MFWYVYDETIIIKHKWFAKLDRSDCMTPKPDCFILWNSIYTCIYVCEYPYGINKNAIYVSQRREIVFSSFPFN
jgi:hypothetical protein